MKSEQSSSLFIIKLTAVDWLTLSSVVTTCLAVGLSLSGFYLLATSLLFIAMCADAFDGILARKYGLERNFGRYLDGFMDVLIYLVSPALIWYQMGFDGLYSLCLVIMIACGCIRLSVFNDIGNIQESNGLSYLGMPVFWSVIILGVSQCLLQVLSSTTVYQLLAIALTIFSVFMLLRRPFFKFKSLAQILTITLGGSLLLFLLSLYRGELSFDPSMLITALYMQIPIVIGGVLHMMIVKKDIFAFLKIPVSDSLFGKNKTWRGIVLMPVLTAFGTLLFFTSLGSLDSTVNLLFLQNTNTVMIGVLLGLGYILAELPNSYIKRRLGIHPGESSQQFPSLFIALDQLDSAIGVAIAYALLGAPASICILYIVTFPFTALLVKQFLYLFKLKASRV